MSKIQNLSVISFLSFGVIVGALVFSRGFLLTRKVISEKSAPCWNSSNSQIYESTFKSLSATSAWCNPTPVFPKLILLLVDALRFDFVDRMTFLSQMTRVKEEPLQQSSNGISSCRLKFVADPPTTTMQRLKALMTGTMPTFIDASANFNSYECEEDSLIYQFQLANKKIAFLGDDTWLGLFPPKLFTSPFVEAHPSFNAWDLDTVDRAVTSSIHRILREEHNEDWDVLIAHILGVDHCGHRYGPNHQEMERKLKDADDLIEYIFNAMNHDTMLVIFGDHGMTRTGDHGGDSQDEIESTLIFLTKQLKRNKQINPPFQCQSSLNNIQAISQVDLVPTIASMMGIPIPYSNIGQIIPDFLVNKIYSDAVAANVAQIQKYIHKYASLSGGNIQELFGNGEGSEFNLFEQYEQVEQAYMQYQSNKNPNSRAKLHTLAQLYLKQVKSKAVSTWTQFDLPTINTGLFISSLSLLSLLIYISYINVLSDMPTYSVLHWLWPSLSHWTILSSSVLHPSGIAGIIVSTISGLCVFLSTLIYKLIRRGPHNFTNPESNHSNTLPTTTTTRENNIKNFNRKNTTRKIFEEFKWFELGSISIYIFSCLAVFSNSFVINEGYILSCLLIMVVLIYLIFSREALKNLKRKESGGSILMQLEEMPKSPDVKKLYKCSWSCFLILGILVRLSQIFFRCREELTQCTEEYLLHKQLNTLPSDWVVHKYVRYCFALFGLSVFVVLFRHWTILRKSTASTRLAPLIANYIPTILVVLIGVFWALQGLPIVDESPTATSIIQSLLHHFPLAYQTVATSSLILIWFKPLCCIGQIRKSAKKIPKEKHRSESESNGSTLKKNSHFPNGLISNNHKSNGFVGNSIVQPEHDLYKIHSPDSLSEDVFSSTILTFGALVTLLLIQVSPDGQSIVITFATYCAILLVGIFRSSSSQSIYSWTSIIAWTLASQFFFYASGHQPVFSSIPWDSAFVGTSTEGNSLGESGSESWIPWIRPGLAVLGNLHVSQIIFAIFLPLLAYFKGGSAQPESLMGPRELRAAYVLGGKYFVLHGFKLFCCMLCASWQRRHLMVWKIFAPRFIFELVSFILTLVALSFSLVFVTRIDYLYQKVLAKEKKMEKSSPLVNHTTS